MMKKLALVLLSLLVVGCSAEVDDYCPPEGANSAMTEFQEIMLRWNDANDIAGATPRMSLGPAVADLQEIKRDAGKVEYPPCLTESYSYLYDGMDYAIKAFIGFMGDEPESEINSDFRMAASAFNIYSDEIAKIRSCLPDCKRP